MDINVVVLVKIFIISRYFDCYNSHDSHFLEIEETFETKY